MKKIVLIILIFPMSILFGQHIVNFLGDTAEKAMLKWGDMQLSSKRMPDGNTRLTFKEEGNNGHMQIEAYVNNNNRIVLVQYGLATSHKQLRNDLLAYEYKYLIKNNYTAIEKGEYKWTFINLHEHITCILSIKDEPYGKYPHMVVISYGY